LAKSKCGNAGIKRGKKNFFGLRGHTSASTKVMPKTN